MNAVAQITPPTTSLVPRNMSEAMQLAEMMARGKMIPEHLRNAGDALMVVEQAMRWNMSPFAVAQATHSVKGKLGYAGTIVAAAIENSGAIDGYIDYQFSGEGQNRKVTVIAKRRGETEPRSVDVLLKDAITDNVWWKKTPDQMLVYHGARVWARRWTPGVMLGVYSREELMDAPTDDFKGTTIDAAPAPHTEAYAAPRQPTPAQPERKRTVREIVRDKLVGCTTEDEVQAVAALPLVTRALAEAPSDVREEIGALLADALTRVLADPDAAHEPVTEDAVDA